VREYALKVEGEAIEMMVT